MWVVGLATSCRIACLLILGQRPVTMICCEHRQMIQYWRTLVRVDGTWHISKVIEDKRREVSGVWRNEERRGTGERMDRTYSGHSN